MTPQQQLMTVVLVIVFFYIIRNVVRGWLKAADATLQNKSELTALATQGVKPTYGEEKYRLLADYLYNAMDGWGTESDDVMNAFNQLRNDADFIKLEQAFGVREATDNMFGLIESQDLHGWIVEDLSGEEITRLNGILKSRGISKRF